MGPGGAFIEVAAIGATVLAVVAALPQLRRVVVVRNGRGVSLSGAMLGVVNESAWVGYTFEAQLWSAVPESVLMLSSNLVLVIWLVRSGAHQWRSAVTTATLWAAALALIVAGGGTPALALVLGGAYAVQVGPAIWTAWRTSQPTGVAASTWALILVESILWGTYGLAHDDPATSMMAVVGVTGSVAILTRKVVVRRCVQEAHADDVAHVMDSDEDLLALAC